MAFGIKLADASFANYIARAVPYLEDTEGVFIFGGTEAASVRNLSPNVAAGSTGSMVGGGSGTFGANHAGFDINYSLDTGIAHTGLNKTIISVSSFEANNHSTVVAPNVDFARINGAFRVKASSSIYLFGAGDTISLSVPTFQGLTCGGGSGNNTAYRGRAGTFQTATTADAPVTEGTISFGPRGGVDTGGDTTEDKHYLGLIYGRELSGSEMANVYAWAAEYLSARGVLLG